MNTYQYFDVVSESVEMTTLGVKSGGVAVELPPQPRFPLTGTPLSPMYRCAGPGRVLMLGLVDSVMLVEELLRQERLVGDVGVSDHRRRRPRTRIHLRPDAPAGRPAEHSSCRTDRPPCCGEPMPPGLRVAVPKARLNAIASPARAATLVKEIFIIFYPLYRWSSVPDRN